MIRRPLLWAIDTVAVSATVVVFLAITVRGWLVPQIPEKPRVKQARQANGKGEWAP